MLLVEGCGFIDGKGGDGRDGGSVAMGCFGYGNAVVRPLSSLPLLIQFSFFLSFPNPKAIFFTFSIPPHPLFYLLISPIFYKFKGKAKKSGEVRELERRKIKG